MKRKAVSIINPYYGIHTHDEYGRAIFLDLEDFNGATITETVVIYYVVKLYVWISKFPDFPCTLELVDTWATDVINRVKYK